MESIVVYTCLFGDKETIGNPLAKLIETRTDLDIEFVCFTNNRQLVSDVWHFRFIDEPLSGERLSRKPKIMPHLYLQEWSYSLYIDNIVQLKRLPCSSDLMTDRSYLFRLFKHTREHLLREADAIISLGYDDPEIIVQQLDHYKSFLSLDKITPLSTCTVMLRSHHHPSLVKFAQLWWEQFLTFSKRDQMSVDFCLKYLNFQVDYFDKPKNDNSLIYKTNNVSGRLRASFDPIKYAWMHKEDKEAVKNPKKHFLSSNKALDIDYNRDIDVLNYLTYKEKSSLGSFIAPRRKVSNFVSNFLMKNTVNENALYVYLEADGDCSFDIADFNASAQVMHQFLWNINCRGDSQIIGLKRIDFLSNKGFFKILDSDENNFSRLIFFNVNNCSLLYINVMVNKMCSKKFNLLLLADESLDFDNIISCKSLIEETYQVSCRLAVNSSHHDSLSHQIDNSIVSITCEKKDA
jgi:hypothetical protein